MPDVVLPVLDEAEAIPRVLAAMPAGYRPIVVDNGSSDGSAEIAAELGAESSREPRRGFGAACYAGLAAAAGRSSASWTATARSTPAQLPEFVAAARRRRRPGDRGAPPERGAWPLHARLANRVLAWSCAAAPG